MPRERAMAAEIRLAALVSVLLLSGPRGTQAAGEAAGQEERAAGRICVAALPKNAAEIDREYRGRKPRRQYTYRFTVRVDSGTWIEIPKEDPLPIDGIATGQRHTLEIRDADQLIESLPFVIEGKGARELCLRYTPWYQTWQLGPTLPRSWWCRCDKSSDGT